MNGYNTDTKIQVVMVVCVDVLNTVQNNIVGNTVAHLVCVVYRRYQVFNSNTFWKHKAFGIKIILNIGFVVL